MWLKHRNDLTDADAPYIETAFFAVGKIESARRAPYDLAHDILNLDQLLRDGYYGFLGVYSCTGNNDGLERSWQRLLERVEAYGMGCKRWKLDYHYTLDSSKSLSDYNMEAQGNVIADYFAHGMLQDPSALSERIHRSDPLSRYQSVLAGFLLNPADPEHLPK